IRKIVDRLPASEVAYFEDEVDIHLNPRIGRDWMLPGRQKLILTPGQNGILDGCASDPATGQIVCQEDRDRDGRLTPPHGCEGSGADCDNGADTPTGGEEGGGGDGGGEAADPFEPLVVWEFSVWRERGYFECSEVVGLCCVDPPFCLFCCNRNRTCRTPSKGP